MTAVLRGEYVLRHLPETWRFPILCGFIFVIPLVAVGLTALIDPRGNIHKEVVICALAPYIASLVSYLMAAVLVAIRYPGQFSHPSWVDALIGSTFLPYFGLYAFLVSIFSVVILLAFRMLQRGSKT